MNGSASESPFALAVLRRCAPLLAVFALWLAAASLTLDWLRLDNTPPSWDPSVHLSHAQHYYAYLTHLPPGDAWAGIGLTSKYYPPLVHVVGALCFKLFGAVQPAVEGLSPDQVPVLGNLLFMALLLFATYSLAARYYGMYAGLLAATLVATYPVLSGQSRLYLLDYPLAAMTVTAMALLAATRGLTHKVWIWPLGVVAGAALWCKWSFLFLFVPAVLVEFRAGLAQLREGDDPELTPTRLGFNLAVVLAGMLLIAGPWYLSHLRDTIHEVLVSNQTWTLDKTPSTLSPAGLTYYLVALTRYQLFVPLTLLAGFGALYAWLHRDNLPGFPLLATWLLSGLIVFTLVSNKNPRFSLPLLPALAILSSSWLALPRGRRPSESWQRSRLILLGVTLAIALVEYLAVAIGFDFLPQRIGLEAAPLFSQEAALTRHPVQQTWPHRDLAADLARCTPRGGKIGVLPNTAQVNYLTLRYYVQWQFLPYLAQARADQRDAVPKVMPVVPLTGQAVAPATVNKLLADGFDTIVTCDGPQGAHNELIDPTVDELTRHRAKFLAAYEPVVDRPMPGGGQVHVYRRRALLTADPADGETR